MSKCDYGLGERQRDAARAQVVSAVADDLTRRITASHELSHMHPDDLWEFCSALLDREVERVADDGKQELFNVMSDRFPQLKKDDAPFGWWPPLPGERDEAGELVEEV